MALWAYFQQAPPMRSAQPKVLAANELGNLDHPVRFELGLDRL
jgi:hypothetical protein